MLTLLLCRELAIWCPDSLEMPAARVAGLHRAGHDVDNALRLDVDATLLWGAVHLVPRLVGVVGFLARWLAMWCFTDAGYFVQSRLEGDPGCVISTDPAGI